MKVTTRKALEMLAGIGALDGLEKAVDVGTEEKPTTKIIRVPFKLGGKLRLAMGKNMVALTAVEQAYEVARKGVIRELANGGDTVPKEKEKDAREKIEELLQGSHEVNLDKIEPADLNLDANNEMPISAIALLDPLFKSSKAKEQAAA